MVLVVLLIVAVASTFTVAKGLLGAWFSKPISAQPVILVSAKGPGLWQRTAQFIFGVLIVAIPAVLLLRYIGQHHDPVTNYAPTVTSTTFPASVTDVPTPPTTGGHR